MVTSIIVFFGFLLGAVIGSFLNVVLYRLDSEETIRGRSHCRSCGHLLSTKDLIPLLSHLILRGRCHYCKAKISIQYPLVEIATALLFAAVLYKLGATLSVEFFAAALWYLVIFSLFVLIVAYDLRHKIIPDQFVYPLIALAALGLFFEVEQLLFTIPSTSDLLSGPLLALPFAFIWLVSGGRWMGLGDAKLSLALGWLFGLLGSVTIFLLSFWIGALVSLALLFVLRSGLFGDDKALTIKSEVPFAPFLIIGAVSVFFFHIDIVALVLSF